MKALICIENCFFNGSVMVFHLHCFLSTSEERIFDVGIPFPTSAAFGNNTIIEEVIKELPNLNKNWIVSSNNVILVGALSQ